MLDCFCFIYRPTSLICCEAAPRVIWSIHHAESAELWQKSSTRSEKVRDMDA